MIFLHIFLHQIGQWDMGFLSTILEDAPLYLLILLAPIGVLSLLGTSFLFCNAVSVSVQMLRLIFQKSRKFPEVLMQRSLTGILYIALFRLGRSLVQTDYFKAGYFYFPKIWVRFAADTVDSIAISAVIISFLFFVLSQILKIHNPRLLFWIFVGLTEK